MRVDVAIVGGSVAGASLGAALAAAGLRVAIVERQARFRDKIRGEALHPWGAAEADRLALVPALEAAGGLRLPIWQRYEERRPLEPYRWAEDVPGGHVEWGVSHPSLQERLLDWARERGAAVLRPAVAASVRRDGDVSVLRVLSGGAEREVRARLVVGADGARSGARRWLGAGVERDSPHHVIGGALLTGVDLDRDAAHQAYLPGGMVVAFPQAGERFRVYVVRSVEPRLGSEGRDAAAEIVAAATDAFAPGALAGARSVGPAGFFPGVSVWTDRLAGNGLVLVGDAAGANDPSQGQGLSLAFRDARLLRDLLLATDDWDGAAQEFQGRRREAFTVLRAHAEWAGVLAVDRGPTADALRARVARAREVDPGAGGFAGIFAFGPDGLVADEAARRRFFGEDDPVDTAAA